ncbi:MAG: sugar ABC transporter permease [Chloroflexota bacterium]|nr:sugar ABC transporter permease [Chloroflexota bacterium]
MASIEAQSRFGTLTVAKRRKISGRTREAIECYIFMLPVILGLLLFYLGPMIASLYFSLTDYDMLTPAEWVGLQNYRDLADDEIFWKSLRVTAMYSTISVPLGLGLALALALLLNQKVAGVTFFRTMYYLPTVMSGVAVATLWKWIFNTDYGILNLLLDKIGIRGPAWLVDESWAIWALILTSMWTVGGSMLIFLAGLQSIPADLYEAAEIDGAGAWNRFRNITVPLISHVTFFNLILGIIGALQVFTEAFVLTGGGPNNSTLLLSVHLYRNAFEFLKMGYASAIAWVMFLIVLLLTLAVFKSAPMWVHYQETQGEKT